MDALDIAIAESSEQRSDNWRDARLGRFTSSEIWRLMSTPRGKSEEYLTDTAITYVEEKVAELMTHQAKVATGWALDWGIDQEPNAIAEFEKVTGKKVIPAGFVPYGEHGGGSVDGYVDNQFIEVKCPYNSDNHVTHLQVKNGTDLKELCPKYYWQIQNNILVNAHKEIYEGVFVSYDPRVSIERLKLHRAVIEANDADLQLIGVKLGAAIKLKNELIKQFGL